MPVSIHITDDEITVTAENGTVVSIDRVTGAIQPKQAPAPRGSLVQRPAVQRPSTPGITQVKVTPRWTVHVGDVVAAQHKKGGRKFVSPVKAIKAENGTTYVQMIDPRSGGTYLIPLDRLSRARS